MGFDTVGETARAILGYEEVLVGLVYFLTPELIHF